MFPSKEPHLCGFFILNCSREKQEVYRNFNDGTGNKATKDEKMSIQKKNPGSRKITETGDEKKSDPGYSLY